MIDRLQFRHHNEVFNSRKEAIEYITTGVGYSLSSVTSGMDVMQASSLFAEPTILAYKNEDDSTNPHVILAIGSRTNPGINSELVQWDDNRFCIIDIDEVKDLIDEHYDEFITAVKALTLIPKNTDTLNLHAASSETGTFISGDVKTEDRFVFSEDSVSVKNNLMVTENGLFMYVNLKYDEENEQFTFSVSNADKTLSSTTITLPNNYLTGGSYDVKDESIHLNLRNGDEVVIDCKNLITEWTVESSASTTPIVLTKERVYDGESELIQPWQDVLRADVRIDTEAEDNILEKSWDGTRLKVDGKASNITCWKNGEKLTVQEALNNLHELKVSNDSRNIIFEKIDGVFSTVNLEYKPNENKLLFTVSGRGISGEPTVTTEEIQLNTISLFKNVWYDSITEELVIEWVDDSGETHYSRISIGQMIEEWEPQNEGHSVEVSRVRNVGGKDKVSADVKIANTQPNNILEDVNHELYVNGTASNIKYNATGTTNVKQVLDNLSANTTFLSGAIDSVSGIVDTNIERIDNTIGSGFTDNSHENITAKFEALSDKLDIEIISARSEEHRIEEKLNDEIDRSTAKDDEHDGKIQAIEDEIGDGFSPRNTVRDEIDNLQSEIDAISGETSAKLKDIDSDNSINIDKTDTTIPKISVALSDEKEYDIENIIKLESDGLYAGVDLDIVSGASGNVLVFKSTNGIKEIPLKTNSVIDKIWYDPYREAIIIEYTVNGQRMPDVVVPVGDLIDEWEVESDHPFAIQLNRKRVSSGSTGHDILSASAITSSDSDNILIIKDNALKVSNVDIVANTNAIAQEIQDRIADVDAEETRAKAEELILINKIGTGFTTADTNNVTAKFNALNTAINNEVTRATSAEQLITNDLQSEFIRATSAETALQTAINSANTRIDGVENALTNTVNTISGKIDTEIADRKAQAIHSAEYVKGDKKIYLKNANNEAISTVDVTDFIVDGMVQSVYVSGDTLVIQWNTDAGITTVTIPFSQIFDPDNYYTKVEVDTKIDAEVNRAEAELRTAITNEVTDRTVADTQLQTSINNETARAQDAENQLSVNLNAEIARATTVETNLSNMITAETAARIAGDNALDARIDSLTGQIATNTANISGHETRITNLESRTTTLETNTGTNANNIATLSGQVTANTSNISTLNTNVTNLTTRVTTNETDIAQLKINTATNATNISTLNTNVNNLTTQVNTNTNNITALSASTGNLQTQITNVNNSVTALTNEVNDLENRVSTNETNISNLQTFGGNVANSRLTIQKNGVTVATYAPTASTTANIEVPTSLSQLTNNLNKLTWSLGTPTADTAGYNGSDGKNITIPSELNHLNASSIKTLTITTNDGTTTTTAGTYNPTSDATINIVIPSLDNLKALTWTNGTANTGTYNGSANTTLNVPSSMQHLSEYNSGVYTIAGAINLSGNLTASSVYSTSDVNLKENIAIASVDKKFLANHIEVKEFNFKNDPNKTKVYGVIAQEVEAAGLNEVVITKEDGYKAVDYTSLMMLKIAYLEKENKHLKDKLSEIEERLKKLEK